MLFVTPKQQRQSTEGQSLTWSLKPVNRALNGFVVDLMENDPVRRRPSPVPALRRLAGRPR